MYQPNLARLRECMRKAEMGEELTIGFLGGSITQGSLATDHENTYAYRVFTWWKNTFPKAQFYYINGGIGGTSSHYGVSRAVTDVLMYQPDFVVVDFSVNDEADAFFQETYEGVIRKLLSWTSAPAVLILNNVYYDTGKNAQEYHNAVAAWYQVPYVSIRDTVYKRMKDGEYTREELTPDGLHPNDKGHGLVAGELIAFLETVKEEMWEMEAENQFPQPMTANTYEQARRLTIREISPILSGFRADTEEKTGHLDHFKNGWIGKKPGDTITFEVEASCIAVQYRKTIQKPAVRARLILDGDAEHAVLLDSNFDEDWGDCLYLEPVLHHGTRTKHTVEIIVPETESGEDTPFYLMSLIIA
ncbi:MAG: SGNH/GDSL hydrolase family protein [Oliverpabstia sp.]